MAAEDFEIYTDDEEDEDEEDDLSKDPDFIDSGTYWLSDEPKEHFVQIAAHWALKSAEEEQLVYLSLLSSSAAKKKANRAFVIKWEKYKIIEAVLNSGDFDSYIQGLGASEDGVDEVSSDGPKSLVSFDQPNTAAEEQQSSKTATKGHVTLFSKKKKRHHLM